MEKRIRQIILIIPICLAALSVVSAQIPNAGFESWVSGSPIEWTTNNVPPYLMPVTQSGDAHSGTSAMQGTVISYFTVSYPPIAWSGFPVSTAHGSLNGWYKFSPVGGDEIEVGVIIFENGSPVAAGGLSWGTSASGYTPFSVPITPSAITADSAWIEILIIPSNSSDSVHFGSTFIIDDLSFGATTSVQESNSANPGMFTLSQNYPNPFNPSTKIAYQIPANGMVRLEVYNILGKTLATLVNEEKPAGKFTTTFDGSQFTSGVYFYRIIVTTRDGKSYSQTNKMILMK
jgi:hypothetical protein